jgi:hypothetical protein
MKIVTLDRFCYTPEGTMGELSHDGFKCWTLENPWIDNEVNISCIPVGVYAIKRDNFKGKYPNFKLLDVPGRTHIEMHRGNTKEHTRGCILTGSDWFVTEVAARVTDSTNALNAFMESMEGIDMAILHIRNRYGGEL